MNLAFNARDAMDEAGTLRFSTRAATYTEEDCRGRAGARLGEFIALSVDDTGTGISAEVIGRVFEPFFTTKPQGQGTGLGLATVYGIASQSGGWTEVQSVAGEGATFTVYLPRAETEAPEPEPGDEILEDSGCETVLVVEDEDAVRLIVVNALRIRGYTVLEAAHGDAAIAVAGEHRGTIDVLVTDEMMPGLRGTQLAEKLVPTRPEMRVLFMSGYSDRIPAGSTFCGTPSSFIGKPFSHEQLVQAVGRLLRRDRQTAPTG
jgi:CheY-like chemotaxis protein